MKINELTGKVIQCAIDVHRELGPGLLESTYEHCLAYELAQNEIDFKSQLAIPLDYKGRRLECGYRIDLLVDDRLIVELKSVDELQGIHQAQILTYMRLSGIKTGLLMNFNSVRLVDGLKRLVL